MSELEISSMFTDVRIMNRTLELEIILNPNIHWCQSKEYHIFLLNIYQHQGWRYLWLNIQMTSELGIL